MSKQRIAVDVVSDVMCPWCFIGKRNLEAAMAIAGELDVEVSWRPYQLDPTIPAEGKDRRQYLEEKFGGPERATAIYDRVREAGRNAGIEFRFEAISVSPNTLDAHRLIRWAGGQGDDVQERVVNRLFERYFTEGADLTDDDELVSIAAQAGMDAEIVRNLLASDADTEETRQDIAMAQRMGVTGVPCFIVDQRYAVVGAQPAEVLAQAIRQAAAEKSVEAKTAAN